MLFIRIIILFALLPLFAAKPQKTEAEFQHLSVQDGLSQSTVNCIFQDSKGLLWFGTSNGLNKYDGYSFTVYHHNPSNKNSLSSDMINTIFEDRDGNLWVGTENGINLMDQFHESFKRYLRTSVMNIKEADGKIIAGTFNEGIYIKKKKEEDFSHTVSFNSSFNYEWCSVKDINGNIWFGTYGGLVKFNPSTNEVNYFNQSFETNAKRIFSLAINNNIIYAGYERGGIRTFDIKANKFISIPNLSKLSVELSEVRVTSLYVDSHGNLWTGSMGKGLYKCNTTDGSFTRYENDPFNQASIGDNELYSILEDKSGTLWFGSGLSGINKLPLNKIKFIHYKKDRKSSGSLTSNYIYKLFKDHAGIIWYGTMEGLSGLDRKSGASITLDKDFTSSIFEDNQYNLWVGTRSGLFKYDSRRNKVNFPPDSAYKALGKEIINEIHQEANGDMLLLSSRGIIYRIDQKSKKISVVFKENSNDKSSTRAMSFIKDSDGVYWIATFKGIFRYDPVTGKTTRYVHDENNTSSISSNAVFSLFEDNEKNIWAGTYGGGLNKYIKSKNVFVRYNEENGLPNNVIYSVLSDDKGALWLSTNKGICRFNIKTGEIRVFDITDGLQSYEFNSGAYCKSNDGEMFFGGLNGFNSFYPSEIKDNPHIPSVAITSVKVFKESYDPSVNNIELPYNSNFINFEFASLDYTNPQRNKYRYKLIGFDKEYVNAGTRRFASYTNLEPGTYHFIVKGSNSDEVWNEAGAGYYFIIKPPFWRTWWFYLLSVLIFFALLYAIYRIRINQKLSRIAFIEQMRKRIADDFHDELGHKLTKISLYSELMKTELEGKINGSRVYLKKINDTANSLYDDTKDFIWSVDPAKDTLYDLAVYLKDFGDELFSGTAISFHVEEISDNMSRVSLPMDWKRQLILLFKEGMNNILRHSNCKNVELTVNLSGAVFEFILKDDGDGMEMNSEGKGRGLINMNNRASKIGGRLLINSDGSGTEIKFIASVNKEMFNNERN